MFRSGKQRCISPEGKPFSRLDPACLPRLIYNFHRAPAPPSLFTIVPTNSSAESPRFQTTLLPNRPFPLPIGPQLRPSGGFRLKKDDKLVYATSIRDMVHGGGREGERRRISNFQRNLELASLPLFEFRSRIAPRKIPRFSGGIPFFFIKPLCVN